MYQLALADTSKWTINTAKWISKMGLIESEVISNSGKVVLSKLIRYTLRRFKSSHLKDYSRRTSVSAEYDFFASKVTHNNAFTANA